jgi:hypothetical protein
MAKNHVISYLPDCPSHQDDDLHEERHLELIFEIFQELKGVCILIHLHTYPRPTLYGKRAVQKEVDQRLIQRAVA